MVRIQNNKMVILLVIFIVGHTRSFKFVYNTHFSLSDICQIRLDFVDTDLQQPASTTGTTAGECVNTILAITAGTSSSSIFNNPPSLCGTLTGQHGKFIFKKLQNISYFTMKYP